MSSSLSSPKRSFKYDVFLSFSGADTGRTFVDHLYTALEQQGINTFKDDQRLEKGKKINDELLESIEDSNLYIIVFSKNYASSSWCLNELVRIMECQMTNEQTAYPVFYDVDPSEVRKQSGAVGEALAKHSKNEVGGKSVSILNKKTVLGKALAKHSKKKLGKWKQALTGAANLSGWDLRKTPYGNEAKVIKLILERVSLELRSINMNVDENLIGMEQRVENLESYLEMGSNDVRMIGIKGMGGAGKTTLARAIFDRLSVQFEGKSFVENVREASKASFDGLNSLQQQVLSDVLHNKGITVSSVYDGKLMMKKMMRHRKVLVVLDDVDHKDQLEALAGEPNWFKTGSRIIITTRDKQVLVAHRVKWIRDVNLLSKEEATILFNRHAFGRNVSNKYYEILSQKVIGYAAGLPLTIKVLGSFLCGKDKPEWIDALERLNTIPLKETLEKLELSYIGLEDDYKEIFLDVACLLKGWKKENAIIMLESCGFHARNGLRVLEQKSLMTFSGSDKVIDMHDHLEEMGKHIVRRLHPNDPNRHSRLWEEEEIEYVLANNLGTEATRSIDLELRPEIALKGLKNMKKLKCLIVDREGPFGDFLHHEKIDEVFQYFPSELRYLYWDSYPYWCLPTTFPADNLVALEIIFGKIKQLWDGGKVMKKLKFLTINFTDDMKICDVGLTPNLERLDLGYCFYMEEIHIPIGGLKKLVNLNLNHCIGLKSLSFIKQCGSLEVLILSDLGLTDFPDIIPEQSSSRLLQLDFSENHIEELPSSIVNLHKLVSLNLSYCKKLKRLPRSFCGLKHLRTLDLEWCDIEELPEDIGNLESLEELDLSWNNKLGDPPNSIHNLKHLRKLLVGAVSKKYY